MLFRSFLSAIAAVFFAVFISTASGQEEPEAEAILVLDASGSMWGQIDGKNKIVIAREVIGELMATWPDEVALGLIAYGHREEGNCADIELMIPVSRAGAATIPGIVNSLNPKGKTPLTQSVQQASEILANSGKPTSIILITDGLETCNADPCALGKSLADAGIDMKVHVVGFDLGGQDTSAIQCLASSTGGQYLTANNALELTEALGQATGQVKSSIKRDVIQLKLSENSEQFRDKTTGFEYFVVDADNRATGKYVDFGYGYEGYPVVAPGKYVAKINLGGINVDFPFEVKVDEKQVHMVNLNGGMLSASAVLDENSEAEQDTLGWEVFPLNADGTLAGRYIQYSYGPTAYYYLPAGDYRVSAQLGSATALLDVVVEAGQTETAILDLRAGKINFSATLSENGPAATGSIGWEAKALDPITGEKGKTAAYSYGSSGTYVMNIGTYMLSANFEGVYWEQPITIVAGEEISETANLNAGHLSLDARLSPTSQALGGSHGWEIYKMNADGSRGDRITYGYGATFGSLLPAGDVEVNVSTGGIERTEKTTIIAAQSTSLTIELDGGRVNYNAIKPSGGSLEGSPGWDVYHLNADGSVGARAGYSYGAGGEYLLPAGRYRISVDGDGFAGSADFELAAGETKTLRVKTRQD